MASINDYAVQAAQSYANKAEPTAIAQSVSDVMQNTLNMLCDVEGYVDTIKTRIYGPRPAEVAQGQPQAQPHLRQSAEIVRDRIDSLMHELREIASVL